MRRSAQEQYLESMSEKALQNAQRDLCQRLGLLYYHTESPWYSQAGWPDTIVITGHRLIVAENKAPGKRPSAAQQAWLDAFRGVTTVETYVWSPRDWDDALQILSQR